MLRILAAGIFTIGLIILIHELGHYFAARAVGIHVHRFSIGFGPALLRWKRWGTEWVISLLPIGGYVRMAGMEIAPMEGEANDEEGLPDSSLFRNKSVGARMLAIVGGPLANLILAALILIGLHTQVPVTPGTWVDLLPESPAAEAGFLKGDRILAVGSTAVEDWKEIGNALAAQSSPPRFELERLGQTLTVDIESEWTSYLEMGLRPRFDSRVGTVRKGGPAAEMGLISGDRILSVSGQPVAFFDEIAEKVNASAGVPLEFTWEHEGSIFSGTAVPEEAEVPVTIDSMTSIGRIFFQPFVDRQANTFLGSIADGLAEAASWFGVTLEFLGRALTGQVGREAVGGPISIFRMAGESAGWGIGHLLALIAFLSTQLCLFNLLPIPILDGGHLLFLLLEAVGPSVSPAWRMRLTMAGLALILSLFVLVMYFDLLKI